MPRKKLNPDQEAATDQEAQEVPVTTQLRKTCSAFIRFGTDELYDEMVRLMDAHQHTFVARFQRHMFKKEETEG